MAVRDVFDSTEEKMMIEDNLSGMYVDANIR